MTGKNGTGQFTGDIFGRVFSGTWMNADKSKSYPFHLIETHRQWQGETSPYRSTKPLVAQAKKGKKDAQFHLLTTVGVGIHSPICVVMQF